MGRYLERIEHTARYTRVNYFAAMDAPMSVNKEFALYSILRMNGIPVPAEPPVEEAVLLGVAFDKANSSSILSCVAAARENARGSRDVISTEVWEAINKYYHWVMAYDQQAFVRTHLYDFMHQAQERLIVIKGKIDETQVHNEAWCIIRLGLLVERASQVLRVLSTKLADISLLQEEKLKASILSHQLAATLRAMESFDMSRKHYRRAPNMADTLEFLLLMDEFPKSYLCCLRRMKANIDYLTSCDRSTQQKGSIGFAINKSYHAVRYTTIEEIEDDPMAFIREQQERIAHLGQLLEDTFFS
jgi:uncharacterized alpha-E superfamily protein